MTEAYRKLIMAARLVLILHETRDNPEVLVPGYRVNLDPQAEKQLRAALDVAIAEVP